jgi:hypothetical protein
MAKINQKYFGNRNIGTGGQQLTVDDNGNVITPADDKIGGEGITGISFSDAGSWMAVSGTPFSGLALPAPTLPGGVQATGTFYYGLYNVTTGAGSVGLVVNDTYTYPAYPGSIIRVVTSGNNGTNATFQVIIQGSSTTLPTDTQTVIITKLTGSGTSSFTVDVFSHIVNVTINEKGSGYVGTETITTTRTNSSVGGIPRGTVVLTTDSGAPGSSTNQENAIFCYAKISDAITNAQPADIIKQRGTKRFKVKTASGTAICELKSSALSSSASTDTGKMTIMAVDDTNGTYYVTKIGGHRCTIVRGNGTAFETNSSVPWVLSKSDPAYDATTTVIIANA